MRILIDADGCPVVPHCIKAAKRAGIPCLILCDTAHQIEREGAKTFVFSKGADSVDFALVNMLQKGDLVVTQDYGLAAMALARGAQVLNQDGMEYTQDNIDGLLDARYISKKVRGAGGRMKGPPKRKKEQDDAFEKAINKIVDGGK